MFSSADLISFPNSAWFSAWFCGTKKIPKF
jgi:hypothetical protein